MKQSVSVTLRQHATHQSNTCCTKHGQHYQPLIEILIQLIISFNVLQYAVNNIYPWKTFIYIYIVQLTPDSYSNDEM